MHEHRGLSIAIALASFGFFASLAFVLVVAIWITFSVYALVKMIGSAPDAANPAAVLVMLVLLVSALVAALGGGIALLGRSMTPRKRKDRLTAMSDAPGT
jgi:hypothetical protein